MTWTWHWTADVYGRFGFGDNPVVDWLRVVCVVGGMVLICVMGRILVEDRRRAVSMPLTQRLRFVSLALADLYISLTEVAVVGSPGTPRLLVGLGSVLCGAVGVWGMREKQKRDPVTRPARRSHDAPIEPAGDSS